MFSSAAAPKVMREDRDLGVGAGGQRQHDDDDDGRNDDDDDHFRLQIRGGIVATSE